MHRLKMLQRMQHLNLPFVSSINVMIHTQLRTGLGALVTPVSFNPLPYSSFHVFFLGLIISRRVE